MKISENCYFHQEEEVPVDPVKGRKNGSPQVDETIFKRRSSLEEIPDDFATRMLGFKTKESQQIERKLKMPDGFAVSIAYNKSGYQLIPKEDLNNE